MVSRSTQGSAREMVDFALIDETVNEWMTDASKAKQADAARPTPGIPAQSADRAPTVRPEPVRPESTRQDIRQGIRQVAGSRPLESKPLPPPVLRRVDQTPLSRELIARLDRVLQRAYASHLVAPEVLRPVIDAGNGASVDWRTVAIRFPDHSHTLGRLAADTYGFRSVLICQMGTLVLADLLTMRVPPHLWRPMFEAGLVPVVEHGASPDPNERILCASHDPSSKSTREFLQGVKSFRAESVYADEGHIRAVMELIAQHVPVIGAEIRTLRPDVVRVSPGFGQTDKNSTHRAA